jgi:hypothetical protein
LAGFEDTALWVDQRDALATEDEAVSKIAGLQVASARKRHPRDSVEGGLPDLRILKFEIHTDLTSGGAQGLEPWTR